MSDRSPSDPALRPFVGGELLAEITNRIVAFMREHYGRGPIKAKTYVLDNLIVWCARTRRRFRPRNHKTDWTGWMSPRVSPHARSRRLGSGARFRRHVPALHREGSRRQSSASRSSRQVSNRPPEVDYLSQTLGDI